MKFALLPRTTIIFIVILSVAAILYFYAGITYVAALIFFLTILATVAQIAGYSVRDIFGLQDAKIAERKWIAYLKNLVQVCNTELRHYVLGKVMDSNGRDVGDVINVVKDWCNSNSKILIIFGAVGSGKTLACKAISRKLASEYLKNPSSSKIPLLIYLRDYPQNTLTDQMVTSFIEANDLDHADFRKKIRDGKVILILDGLDEAKIAHYGKSLHITISQLGRFVRNYQKVILTCRTNYLETANVHELKAEVMGSWSTDIQSREIFSEQDETISCIYLKDFEREDIEEYLKKIAPNKWQLYLSKIDSTYNLRDLSKRPILLNLIGKVLSMGIRSKRISRIKLYEMFTEGWVKRENWKGIDESDILSFMMELAYQMYTCNIYRICSKDLNDNVRTILAQKIISLADIDFFAEKLRTCGFLDMDAYGFFSFGHKSFIEFFVAKKIYFDILNNKQDIILSRILSDEVQEFIAEMISEKDGNALKIISEWTVEGTGWTVWNACSLLSLLKADYYIEFVRKNAQIAQRNEFIIWTLGEMHVNDPEVVKFLQEVVRNCEDDSAWWNAAFALNKICRTNPIQLLMSSLKCNWSIEHIYLNIADRRAPICLLQKYNNGDLSKSEIVDVLSKSWTRHYTEVKARENIIWLIGKLGLNELLPLLESSINDPNPTVRNRVAEALGELGYEQAAPLLLKMLKDSYYRTRMYAAESLLKIDKQKFASVINEARKNEEHKIVRNYLSQLLRGV